MEGAGLERRRGTGPVGPTWAPRAGAVEMAAKDRWQLRIGRGRRRTRPATGRTCPAARGGVDLGFIREMIQNFGEGLFIGIGGARRVQMRCGFRPRDRDRTTKMMEEV